MSLLYLFRGTLNQIPLGKLLDHVFKKHDSVGKNNK